ncbi:GntR family transcriptional regulator [Streptomyces lydicamycinicus]|uniref:GntR family transcriptional regulator n=1 Tax=Streptomyces lydicamycinicus TaxID=1546107 RepID=UPI003C2BE705
MADEPGLRHEGPSEQFSQTPLWVIMRCRKEVWLYDYLRARYGGLDQTFPGLDTIAKAFKVSRSTVERALEALKKAGAIEVRPRWKENGAQTTNEYVTMWRPRDQG